MRTRVEKTNGRQQVIGEWVEPQLEGPRPRLRRGELMDYPGPGEAGVGHRRRLDFGRISAVRRAGAERLPGDMTEFMRAFPDRHFDRIICRGPSTS